jgi:WD40 repeat protein
MRGAVLMVAACSAPAVGPVVVPRVAVPRPIAAAIAERIGGPPTWADVTGAEALRLCRDDRELLVIDSGWLRRYRTTDGGLIVETEIGERTDRNDNRRPTLDCRTSDGAALVVTGAGSPEIVDEAGRVTSPPAGIHAIGASFSRDGSVRAIDEDGAIVDWRGSAVTPAGNAGDPITVAIGDGGTVLAFDRTAPGKDAFAWTMIRDGERTQLPPGKSDTDEAKSVSIAPDGTIAIEGELGASAWIASGKRYAHGIVMYDGGGARLGGIAATDRGFAVLQGHLYYRKRVTSVWRDVADPCGNEAFGLALDRDDRRAYVGCDTGVHVVDLADGRVVSADGDTAAGAEVAWSPDGDRLAVRGHARRITVWRGATLVKRLAADSYDVGGLWWSAPAELGGGDGRLVAWPLAGDERAAGPELDGALFAHALDGTVVALQPRNGIVVRGGGRDRAIAVAAGWIGALALDPAGKRAAVAFGEYNQVPWKSVVAIDLATGGQTPYPSAANAIAVDSTTTVIAFGDSATVIHDGGAPRSTLAHGAEISSLAIDRGVIALGGKDGIVSLWKPDGTPIRRLTGAKGRLDALAFSPDGGQLAATGVAGTWVWRLADHPRPRP